MSSDRYRLIPLQPSPKFQPTRDRTQGVDLQKVTTKFYTRHVIFNLEKYSILFISRSYYSTHPMFSLILCNPSKCIWCLFSYTLLHFVTDWGTRKLLNLVIGIWNILRLVLFQWRNREEYEQMDHIILLDIHNATTTNKRLECSVACLENAVLSRIPE